MTQSQFETYLRETRGRMLRFAVTILRDRAEAEDVVSQVVERLWGERERLREGSTAATYAMSAVRNGCYDLSRRRQRWRQEEVGASLESRERSEEQRDRVELVRFAMGQLPAKQREILHLKDIEGYTTHEIAEIFQLEESNIRVILSRSRIALRDIIIKNRN